MHPEPCGVSPADPPAMRPRPAVCPFPLTPPLSSVTEHQNYFGIDENLGPVAVSIRREKVEDAKEKEGSQFNYRVAFRTSEVMGCLVLSRPGWGLGCDALCCLTQVLH